MGKDEEKRYLEVIAHSQHRNRRGQLAVKACWRGKGNEPPLPHQSSSARIIRGYAQSGTVIRFAPR